MIFRSTGVGWWARSYSIFRCLETQNLQGTLPFTGIETIQKRSLENGTHFITELSMLFECMPKINCNFIFTATVCYKYSALTFSYESLA